jgi:hypothetical protein
MGRTPPAADALPHRDTVDNLDCGVDVARWPVASWSIWPIMAPPTLGGAHWLGCGEGEAACVEAGKLRAGGARYRPAPHGGGLATGPTTLRVGWRPAEGVDLPPQRLPRRQAGGGLGLRDENLNSGGPRRHARVAEIPRRQLPRISSWAIIGSRVLVLLARGFSKGSSRCIIAQDHGSTRQRAGTAAPPTRG